MCYGCVVITDTSYDYVNKHLLVTENGFQGFIERDPDSKTALKFRAALLWFIGGRMWVAPHDL